MPHAPIAIFTYRRLKHLDRMLESLFENPEAKDSAFYFFCDGAKGMADLEEVRAVHEFVQRLPIKQKQVQIRPQNLGLSRNVTSGVTEVLSRHDKIVVLEDDLVFSPHFLSFMNDALGTFEAETRVGNITGYRYPVRAPLPESFLVRGPQSWSWATWANRWQAYEPDGRVLLQRLKDCDAVREFDFDGQCEFTNMLVDQIEGRNDSWAIRWYASCFLRGWLTLYPGQSLVNNIGTDGSGTHGGSRLWDVDLARSPVHVVSHPIEENSQARAAFIETFARVKRQNNRRALLHQLGRTPAGQLMKVLLRQGRRLRSGRDG